MSLCDRCERSIAQKFHPLVERARDTWSVDERNRGVFSKSIEKFCWICCTILHHFQPRPRHTKLVEGVSWQIAWNGEIDGDEVSDAEAIEQDYLVIKASMIINDASYSMPPTLERDTHIVFFEASPGNGLYNPASLAGLRSQSTTGHFPRLIEGESTGSEPAMNQARWWVQDCIDNHVNCQSSKRLGEITTSSSRPPSRLLEISDCGGMVRLCLTHDDPGRYKKYMSVSHRWESPETMTLLQEGNLEQMMEYASVSKLPRRFQDALFITRQLKCHFLWIDCLCIIQDSKDDWMTESSQMLDVYSGSFCNIAICDASRDGSCIKPCANMFCLPYVKIPMADHPRGPVELFGFEHSIWYDFTPRSKLSLRGWFVQERVLSPRILYMGFEQIFWECDSRIACQSFPIYPSSHDEIRHTSTVFA
ncbi:heterokaryon incompatibility protein-domain-containing protein [Xylariaceae sp. FL0255]|nr:heterokaryon incompatibility protein-domain-containing protein [Xylariaceae sp. FL0255]